MWLRDSPRGRRELTLACETQSDNTVAVTGMSQDRRAAIALIVMNSDEAAPGYL